jgi:hypothetical protein
MAWSAGPGELTSIAFGGTTITSEFLEGYSLTTEKDSYDAAIGHSVDRGSMSKTLSVNAFDVSAINAIHTLMTARTESTVTVTYQDSQTQALNECIIRVTPVLNGVSDVAKVWHDNASSGNNALTSNWDDCGVTMDVPTISFSFPFDGTDGLGRPYFSSCAIEVEFMLPGDQYATFTDKGTCSIAFALPDGNFQVMKGGRIYKNYADDDGSMPRAVRLVYRAVGDSWGDLIEFTDGGDPTATTEVFNASTPTLMQDYLHGILIEAVGRGYDEADVTTF